MENKKKKQNKKTKQNQSKNQPKEKYKSLNSKEDETLSADA